MNNKQAMNPTGHLTIFKKYEDGSEELYFDENNVVTSGMAVGFSHLFAASGGTSIVDYQIVNFLVGSGVTDPTDWGSDTGLVLEDYYPIEDGSILGSTRAFARIRFSNIHKVTSTSVRYTLVLDRDTLNGKTLNEVGLFMRNPRGSVTPNPILAAYRPFTEITKTSDFSLIFRWTLQF